MLPDDSQTKLMTALPDGVTHRTVENGNHRDHMRHENLCAWVLVGGCENYKAKGCLDSPAGSSQYVD
jgi:hypothetical protein